MRRVVEDVWKEMQGLDAVPAVGVSFFSTDDQCGLPDEPVVLVSSLEDSTHLNALVAAMAGVKPKGATPIVGSLMRAYSYLQGSTTIKGNEFVVLLTDGAESCDEDYKPKLLQKVGDAATLGIKTFVLGVPGSEVERSFLSKIAFAGQTARAPSCNHTSSAADVGDCHMDMSLPGMVYASELKENLRRMIAVAGLCGE